RSPAAVRPEVCAGLKKQPRRDAISLMPIARRGRAPLTGGQGLRGYRTGSGAGHSPAFVLCHHPVQRPGSDIQEARP
ncbi:MAG: hypothetical protein WBM65_05435, partial [Sedimenticolaceae bacterium]